ncbi:MAG: DUF6134 family protein [Pseudomonadota bacterium]
MRIRATIASGAAALMLAPAFADTAETGIPDPRDSLTTIAEMWTPEAGDQISFTVLRKGNPFGYHRVSFDETTNGDLTVRTEVELRAGLGPITVFKYTLDSAETWRDGTLIGLSGKLNDDGRKGRVQASADGDVLVVDGSEFEGQVDLGILPSSHWNVKQSKADRLVSTEDGEILTVTMVPKGTETIQVAGETIEASRYLLDSDIDVDLWYDETGRWVKLTFEARGQTIEYVLDALY